MNLISWLLLIAVGVAVVACVYYMFKTPGCGCSQGGCKKCESKSSCCGCKKADK